MERISGLDKLVASQEYRSALDLPQEVSESYELLAQGEYNINYKFVHPTTGQKLLLRVNCGSQMHLEHQIEYEANALNLLADSGRTPKVLYVDGSKKYLEYGILIMEYLPGVELDYRTRLKSAAECLADIHSVSVPEEEAKSLISPENPLKAILEECEEMLSVYLESDLGDDDKKKRLRNLLDAGWKMLADTDEKSDPSIYRCIINTELNSTNFLIHPEGETSYLVDWEKPLYGEVAQDLGHFLAPTTTFWKTDVILSEKEREEFVADYIGAVDGRFSTERLEQRVKLFTTITCLRGLTWCAMAWIQYQDPDKLIVNESTKKKLDAYLEDAFLTEIEVAFKCYLPKL